MTALSTPEPTRSTSALRAELLGRATAADLARLFVKGHLVAARRRYVESTWGSLGVTRVTALLTGDALQAFVRPPLPFVWVGGAVVAALDEAIIVSCMDGQCAQMRAFGAVVARDDLPLMYRVFFRVGEPWMVVKLAGAMFPLYFRTDADVASALTGQTGGTITLKKAVMPRYLCRDGIVGWVQGALELSGGKDVRVEHERCVHNGDDACLWRVAWSR